MKISAKMQILTLTLAILMMVLAAVILDRERMESRDSAEAATVILPPVAEAMEYFETEVPPVPDDGPEADYIFTAAVAAPEDVTPGINIANDVRLTAYCSCEVCCGYWATVRPVDELGNQIVYTATGERAVQGVTVAVDPAFIPHGSYVYVQDPNTGEWREFRATDTSPVTGHVDVYFADHAEALWSGYGGYGTVYWAAEPVDLWVLA